MFITKWNLIAGASALLMGTVLSEAANSKPSMVLVHGAFQDGKSTWARVRPLLEAKGYRVVVVTLPGRDGDGANPKELTTQTYRDVVLKAIEGEKAPVVLVGHSFGGITITNVAESAPDRIQALVYLSAYLPANGQSMLDLAKLDRDSHLGKPGNLILAPDFSTATIKPDAAADVFANDANTSDRDLIVSSLIAEPAAPQGTPVQLTERNFGRVPKFYIETARDQCVSPYLQKQMLSKAGVTQVTAIEAGHASYITQPDEVANAILNAALAHPFTSHR